MRYPLPVAVVLVLALVAGCTMAGTPPASLTPAPTPVIVTGTPTSFYGAMGALQIDILEHAMTRTPTNATVNGLLKNPGWLRTGGYFTVRWFDTSGAVLGATNAKVPILSTNETYRFGVAYDGATPAAEVDHYALAAGELSGYSKS
jgi:hypothetical protein